VERQALETGIGLVVKTCPFCAGMLKDGLSGLAGTPNPRVGELAEHVGGFEKATVNGL